ncbi:DNA ligase (ATP) [Elasticomyces elasticus]|nr:DNA ligase (ATP) [Elasticomyces elasticus]
MSTNTQMRDAAAVEEEQLQYGRGALTEADLDEKFPNRPHNHSRTFPFRDLYLTLFNPLLENRKKPAGPVTARKKQGPHGPTALSPNEARRAIIERFISRWRKEVGDDIYPAFRLILPEKDRDRAMYGLKEKTIGKLLVRILKIDKHSEDGYNLLNWKLPSQKIASASSGDFAGRCFEVLSKRPMRTTPGDLTVGEVNEMLDRLSVAQREENQVLIIEELYKRMNAEEMLWLIRIILRQMHIGATERTIFDIWHPDAENLFNVSSSLRRVCWELYDLTIRLEGEDRGISLMQCFQPQLAAFQMHSMERMLARMSLTAEDPVFWIEEKLDGERMQLHMAEDSTIPGGRRFCFWSRKAKDYIYLYGSGFQDSNAALTRHISTAFNAGVRNIILDGEMITWDPDQDAIVPFGTLKTAALSESRNPYQTASQRPLYRVFDCLYLNDCVLTNYTLRDRRNALEASINSVHRRLEVHTFTEATNVEEIEDHLRRVIAESSEGLVLKNPRSPYRLNQRNDDWMKVKPEYMTEFGEALDCLVIGGYYGSGNRGGRLSSFLCGLKVDPNPSQLSQGVNPMKCFSFFKVGGGFAAADYAEIRHRTDGKWHDWDAKKPPTHLIELGGGDRQYEKPDVWIRPDESVVLEVKAASVTSSDQFRMNLTLRFPRFKRLRTDKDWKSALSIQEFIAIKDEAEKEVKEKQFKVDDARKKRSTKKRKREVVPAGTEQALRTVFPTPEKATEAFEGLNFYIMTEAQKPIKKNKQELEAIVKAYGGHIVQSDQAARDVVCVADKSKLQSIEPMIPSSVPWSNVLIAPILDLVKVASLVKRGERNVIRPSWILDCIAQNEVDARLGRPSLLLPFEPQHMWFTRAVDEGSFDVNIDEFGDSFARDVITADLNRIFISMSPKSRDGLDDDAVLDQFHDYNEMLADMPGLLFRGLTLHIAYENSTATDGGTVRTRAETGLEASRRFFEFAGGAIVKEAGDATHVVVGNDCTQKDTKRLRREISRSVFKTVERKD